MTNLFVSSEEKVLKTPRFEIVRVKFNDSDGNEKINHTIIKSVPSVAAIVRKEGRIALIKQFRSTTGKEYYELPAGLLNEGETEVEAAVREIREETGYLTKNVEVLVKGPSLLDPSKSNENFGVVIAEACGKKTRCLDDMEEIDSEVVWMYEDEVFERIQSQMFEGTPFYNGLFISGHSLYAIMVYMLSKKCIR